MRHRSRLALLAAVLGLVAPAAIGSSPASAIDQDLQLSAVSGAPGTQVEVTSASCSTKASDDHLRFLSVRMLAGNAPAQVLAGAGTSLGVAAVLVVPDWIDPDEPAVIQATCFDLTFDEDTGEVTDTSAAFDPVAFDVLAGSGAPVQQRTFNRTSLQVGQAFRVEGSGCFLPGATFAGVDVLAGDDPSAATLDQVLTSGGGDLDGQGFTAEAALLASSYGMSSIQEGDEPPVLEVEESSTDIPEGPATAFTYCATEDGAILMFEPQLLDITGTAPVDDIDLVVPPESHEATLSGGSCTDGEVAVEVLATSAEDFQGDFDEEFLDEDLVGESSGNAGSAAAAAAPAAAIARLKANHGLATVDVGSAARRLGGGHAARALADEAQVSATVAPAADGSWTFADTVAFDSGFVEAFATCGDPFADGFLYDPQVALVDVSPEQPNTLEVVPISAPPATPIPGRADYAG